MASVIVNDNFKISKDPRKSTLFTIDFPIRSDSLINSIIMTKQIFGSTVSDDYRSITFNASSIKSFSKYQNSLYKIQGTKNMNYETVLKLISCLTKQIHYLIMKESKIFYLYDQTNIIVVDDSKFIYLSNDHLMDIKGDFIQVNRPFSCLGFVSPEIIKINSIPSEVNYKIIYYSLAALAVYCLFNINITNTDINLIELNNILAPIEGTKLYWLLLRCLDNDVKRRVILYI
jgi:hypothetical protein